MVAILNAGISGLKRTSQALRCVGLCLLVLVGPADAARLKDLASLAGVRENQLIGYGLVVGLSGSGDKAPFTDQSFRNMMTQLGITLPAGIDPKLKNVAAVAVHANLPAFSKPGQAIDVTVSSLGNAKSLRGGSLLLTPLKGVDGQVYALAQGNLVVGGFDASGRDGSRVTVNVPSSGRIPNGATVERAVASRFFHDDRVMYHLKQADFTTARRVVEAINDLLGPGVAAAVDAATVQVSAPRDASQRVAYLAMLENLDVEPGEAPARVVINSRTGTIVVGQHVRITPVAVTHGSLTVTIQEDFGVSQPQPFAEGDTVVVPDTGLQITEGDGRMFEFDAGVSVESLVQAVNRVGAAPSDLMAILEALKQAGALKADLIVI
ncbi:MAG: flagellar basal body P-ring protein FlgI [Pseudomonadota bacterium]|nr:flagellar basal body P-ring protein FlgI [Pseudomonadota bacterium]